MDHTASPYAKGRGVIRSNVPYCRVIPGNRGVIVIATDNASLATIAATWQLLVTGLFLHPAGIANLWRTVQDT